MTEDDAEAKTPDEEPTTKPEEEKIGYFRRVGRFFKNLFTWSSSSEEVIDIN